MKKKLVFLLSVALLIISCTVGVSADNDTACDHDSIQNIGTVGDLNKQSEEPYGLLCSLLGHNNEYAGTEMELQHRLRITVPYCDKVMYIVYTCSRCGNVESEETSRVGSYCCS